LFIFNTCNKNVDYTQLDEDIILQYISDNNLNAEPTGSGLYYVINSTGNGEFPNINSLVTVAYKGTLTDGTTFDQSSSNGITFPLSNVIQGWQEGIPLFSEGGSGILLIPSALGYGSQSVGNIPENSVLIFEVTLLNVD
jgi:FKBP-type peptidyl-prolyl cis-trans isomerase FkpA